LQVFLQTSERCSKLSCRLCTAEGVGSNPLGSTSFFLLFGENQPVGEKNRSLFSFVTDRVGSISLQPAEKRRLGKELVTEWDRERSQDGRRTNWVYRGDTRSFWRDYSLARKLITLPKYQGIGDRQE
jgi:hypothetical protein